MSFLGKVAERINREQVNNTAAFTPPPSNPGCNRDEKPTRPHLPAEPTPTQRLLTLTAKKCWPFTVVSMSPLATVVRGRPVLASSRACKRNSSRIRRPHSRANGLSNTCPERSALQMDGQVDRQPPMGVANRSASKKGGRACACTGGQQGGGGGGAKRGQRGSERQIRNNHKNMQLVFFLTRYTQHTKNENW